ncbi:MAG: hypothetical protein M3R08_09325 [Bacteroidota bacterium]|nr:hypothetical protein [Bacteroidota bacterium]
MIDKVAPCFNDDIGRSMIEDQIDPVIEVYTVKTAWGAHFRSFRTGAGDAIIPLLTLATHEQQHGQTGYDTLP